MTRVRISRGFWLGKHEVTQSEWQAITGTNPSYFSGCGKCPVESVSWNDVQNYIRKLNARAGRGRYRLPTEAEWEYAARAGTSGDRYQSNLDGIAWYSGNRGKRTQPVGRKAPNGFGLHDMLGNVWEWVQDWYSDYPGGLVVDPRGPGSGSDRVSRGGSWLRRQSLQSAISFPCQAVLPLQRPWLPPAEASGGRLVVVAERTVRNLSVIPGFDRRFCSR